MGSLASDKHSDDRISDASIGKGELVPKIPTQIVASMMLESGSPDSFIANVKKHPVPAGGRWGTKNRQILLAEKACFVYF